jgi:hypothetical protein
MKKLLLLSFFIFGYSLYAQQSTATDIKALLNNYEVKLDSIDKEAIKTKYFLNKGFLMSSTLDDYFAYQENDEGGFTVINEKSFKSIYKGLLKSDLRKTKRLPKIDFKSLLDTYDRTPNIVPIGVIQAKGEFLDSLEIEDNIKKGKSGTPIISKYHKYFLFSAAALKKRVYSGDITFEVVPELFNLQNPKIIKSLEVDFSDGNGFRKLDENSSFNVRYESIGEKVVAIRFKQNKKAFTSYSMIKVITLDVEQPDMMLFPTSGQVQRGKTSIEQQFALTNAGSTTSGGSASVYLGCDIDFDQPVIVIEGFDPLNENSSANLRANYISSGIEQAFRSNGYDMIYFNFQKGGDDIIQNASIVRNLIQQVNREKIGNQDIIVIGESMGGLVARFAIRSLEQSNYTHNVSHYISFDAPHKGANLPLGLQTLVDDLDDQNVRNALGFGQEEIDDLLDQINSPAAKQMLLYYRNTSPDPAFNTLQNELDRVGFPIQGGISNIAIVNGAIDGSVGEANTVNSPSERIIDIEDTFDTYLAPVRIFANATTNAYNGSSQVSRLRVSVLRVPITNKDRFFNFGPLNYDLAAGGLVEEDLVIGGIEDVDELRFVGDGFQNFAFVPVFSSMASERSTTGQAELNRSRDFLMTRGQTPFDRIYGNNNNSPHIVASDIANQWDLLLTNEFGINLSTFCNQTPLSIIRPPSPRINGSYFYTCENSGGSVTLRVDNNPDFLGNVYSHSWSVTGPRNMSGSGDTFGMSSTLPTGVYTVSVTRSFSAATINDLPNGSTDMVSTSSSSRAFSVLSYRDRICENGGGPGPGPGGGIPLKVNLENFNAVDDSEMVIWPNPTSDIINVSYKVEEPSEVSISLISINNIYDHMLSLGSESRQPGEYTDGFDIGVVAEGVYVLVVDINGIKTRKKVIIKK